MAKNSFQKLQDAKTQHCGGKKTKTQLNEAAKKYVDYSIKKGMDPKEAQKKADGVVSDSCAIGKSGKKKGKSTAKVGGTSVAAAIKKAESAIGQLKKVVAKASVKGTPTKRAVKGTKMGNRGKR